MSHEEAQVASLNAMLDVLYNEQCLDTPYDGADEEDEFQWHGSPRWTQE